MTFRPLSTAQPDAGRLEMGSIYKLGSGANSPWFAVESHPRPDVGGHRNYLLTEGT
jgi:hypothetical protein